MKIKMLQSTPGSNDGMHVTVFSKGVIYTSPEQISEKLKKIFFDIKVAEEYIDPEVVQRRNELDLKFRNQEEEEEEEEVEPEVQKGLTDAPSNKKEETPKKKRKK